MFGYVGMVVAADKGNENDLIRDRNEPLSGTTKRWKEYYIKRSGGVKWACSESDLLC